MQQRFAGAQAPAVLANDRQAALECLGGEPSEINIVLGIVGAVVGGEIFTALGESRVTGFNLYNLVVSVIGAIIVLVIYHAIAGRRVL